MNEMKQSSYQEKVMKFEDALRAMPGTLGREAYPLRHNYADGCYIREIKMPAGHIIVSEIHKKRHPYFVLEGECSVITETGVERIKAPYYSITPAGTKRVLYIHKDTTWITVHVTDKVDLDEI